MSYFVDVEARLCCREEGSIKATIEDPTSAITTGNTYFLTNISDSTTGCFTILLVSESRSGVPTYSFDGNTYTCESCLSGITNSVAISSCSGELVQNYNIPFNQFTILPTIGNVYFIVILFDDGTTIEGCFEVKCYEQSERSVGISLISESYTGCTECIVDNLQIVEVVTCLDPPNQYYLEVPAGIDYTNYLVSFLDESGDIQCGTIRAYLDVAVDATLISIFGSIDEIDCEVCLSGSTEKRIITNCLTQQEDVIWGSVYYNGNEVSNLSFEDGCYEVGDLTESAVTINYFLDFDPQPDCQECIECSGIYYTFSSCTESGPVNTISYNTEIDLSDGYYGPLTGVTDGNGVGFSVYIQVDSGSISAYVINTKGIGYKVNDTINISNPPFGGSDPFVITISDVILEGDIFSSQYTSSAVGNFVYVPQLNDCVQITSISNVNTSVIVIPMYSFNVYENCPLCSEQDFYVWLAEDCLNGYTSIVVLPDNTFTSGDYVKIKKGSIDFICHELISPYEYSDDFYYASYKSDYTISYSDCSTCNENTYVGVSIGKCGGGGQQYINVPIEIYNLMGYGDNQSIFVFENFGQCYGLLNPCALQPNYETRIPVALYQNCFECYNENTRFPRSGGTEYQICVICCPCGSSGSTITQVSPPHPVWTDGYGTPVTQLGMVTIGGNGLNS